MKWWLGLALLAAAGGAPVAQVTHVDGSVTVVRAGAQEPVALKGGESLLAGDRVTAAPGADATLLVGGTLRRLAACPGGRWTAGEPFAAAGPEPTSRPAGPDFAANDEVRKQIASRGVLAVIGGSRGSLSELLDQKSGGGGGTASSIDEALRGSDAPGTAALAGVVAADAGTFALPGEAAGQDGLLVIRRSGRRRAVHRAHVHGARFEVPARRLSPGAYVWTFTAPGRAAVTGAFRVEPTPPR